MDEDQQTFHPASEKLSDEYEAEVWYDASSNDKESMQPQDVSCAEVDLSDHHVVKVWHDFKSAHEESAPQELRYAMEEFAVNSSADACFVASSVSQQESHTPEEESCFDVNPDGRPSFRVNEEQMQQDFSHVDADLPDVHMADQRSGDEEPMQQDFPQVDAVLLDDHAAGSEVFRPQDVAAAEGLLPADQVTYARNDSRYSINEESTLKASSSLSGGEDRQGDEADGPVRLYIDSASDLEEFLREILKDFVATVMPKDLMDHMIAAGCLTLSDKSSLNGHHVHTCAEQARKLWSFMNTMSVEDFKAVVFPQLLENYPHIIPEKYCQPRTGGGQRAKSPSISNCLRHNLMRRARLTTVADSLYQCCCMKLEKFQEIVSNSLKLTETELWGSLFRAIAAQDDAATQRVVEEVHEVLQHYRLEVPRDLAEQIRTGVPCTCRLHIRDLPPGAPPLETVPGEEGDVIGSLHSSSENSSRPSVSRFQTPGSQYLGSDDPDFKLPEPDPEFEAWAKKEGLSEVTMRMLLREDFTSKQDLKLLKVDSLEMSLPQVITLPGKQRALLKRLIEVLLELDDVSSADVDRVEADTQPSVPGLSELLPDDTETVRLLLVGKTGAGKSSSGNTVLGQEKFPTGLSMASTTQDHQYACSLDKKVEVMDCPGLFDTSLKLEDLCTIIVSALLAMYPRPTALLYTIRIGDHYTDEELETFRRLKILFGKEICRYMIVLFTRGDDLKRSGKTIEDYVKESPERFKKVLSECGGRYVAFDNTEEGKNRQQIADLKEKICEIMDRDGDSLPDLQLFTIPQKDIQAEINRRIKKFGTYAAKKGIMNEGGDDPDDPDDDGLFAKIWRYILALLQKLAEIARLSS